MFRYFYIIFAIALLWVVVLVNKLLPVPFIQKQEQLANPVWEKSSQLDQADSLTFELIYHNLNEHFSKPSFQNVLGGLYFRDDKTPEEFYLNIATDENLLNRKFGKFGLSLIYKNWKNHELVLQELEEIEADSNSTYYFNELGWALYNTGYYKRAVDAFQKELSLPHGNHDKANEGIARAYFQLRNFDAIHNRMKHSVFVTNCPEEILKKEYYSNGPILSYLKLVVQREASWAMIGIAFLVSVIWGYYYSYYKIFGRKDYLVYSLIFIVSCALLPFCLFLYDTFQYVLNFTIGHSILSTLTYMIFEVGVIEELTKSIPVILMIVIFKKRITEPVDYLLCATYSALGFAFMENIMYFDSFFGDQSFNVIHKRSVLSVILHIFCSVVIWYGFVRTKLSGKVHYLIVCVVVSIAVHGLYDFFLLIPSTEGFYIFSVIMVVLSFFCLKAFYNSALNNSPLFNPDTLFPTDKSSFTLVVGLCVIILFEFVLDSIRFGAPHANDSLMSSLLAYVILVGIYSSNVSRIILSRNHWVKMKNIFTANYSPYRSVGCEIVLLPVRKSNHPLLYPLYGTIIELQDYKESADNYLIKLTIPILFNNQTINNVFVSVVNHTNEKHIVNAKLYYQSNTIEINNDKKNSKGEMILLDYCLLETAVEKSPWFYQIRWNWKTISFAIGSLLLTLFSFVALMNYSTSIDYYREAEKSLSKLDVYEASMHCKRALYFNANNFESRMLFAKIRMDGGFYNEALTYLFINHSIPDYIAPDYYAVKGMAYYKLNAFHEALSDFKKCEGHIRQFDSLYWYQSLAFEKKLDLNNSVKSMRFFLADKKHVSDFSYYRMGNLLMDIQQYEEATSYFDELVKHKYLFNDVLFKRGLCNHYLNKKEQSCIDLETSYSYDNPEAIHYLNKWCRMADDSVTLIE